MVNPGPIVGLVVYILRQQQQTQVTSRVDRALDQLDLAGALRAADDEIARTNNWLVKELVQMRKAMATSMLGGHTTALDMLRPLHVDSFPRLEKARYFNIAMLSWLLLDRPDAARDIVETQMHLLRGMHLDGTLRTRQEIAMAAFASSERDFARARPVLQRISRHRKPPLHRLLALWFLGQLEQADSHEDEALTCFAQAAGLSPTSFAARTGTAARPH